MSLTVQTKWCPRCKAAKPITEFGKNASRKDGLHSYCRNCTNECSSKQRRERYANDSEYHQRRLNHAREYSRNNPNYRQKNLTQMNERYVKDLRYRQRNRLRAIKQRCLKANIPFNLSLEDIALLMETKTCPILGIPLDWNPSYYHKGNAGQFDRLDPVLGYIKGNVFAISTKANLIKSNGTAEEHRKISDWMFCNHSILRC